ncbi:lamin tail domain-containing protein [Streptomyces sp. NPDC086766]|uniref:lamin tail domain-containing protein n=1 Tax=Streptomyces sp. NPDC086766 TaxID=3365754 RepID=UPI0038030D95
MSTTVTARRLAAAALTAAALTGAVAMPASAADHVRSHGPRVEISAVHHASQDRYGRYDRSGRALNKEWVEVTNTTRHAVNLDGWTLADEDGHRYTFHHYRLYGRATVRVHTGFGRDTGTDVYQDRFRSIWDRHSDTVTLRNDRGRYVDSVSWGDDRDRRGHDGDRHHHGDRGHDVRR